METEFTTHTVPPLEMSPFDPAYGAEPIELTEADLTYRHEREQIVEKGREAFLQVGTALMEIKEYKGGLLYKQQYGTFDNYCRRHLRLTARHVYRQIEATKSVAELRPRGHIPHEVLDTISEKQWREIDRLPDNDSKEALIIEAVAVNDGKVPSSSKLKTLVDERLTKSGEAARATAPPPANKAVGKAAAKPAGVSEPPILITRDAVKTALKKIQGVKPADRPIIEDCVAKVATVLNDIAGANPDKKTKAAVKLSLETVLALLTMDETDHAK